MTNIISRSVLKTTLDVPFSISFAKDNNLLLSVTNESWRRREKRYMETINQAMELCVKLIFNIIGLTFLLYISFMLMSSNQIKENKEPWLRKFST